MICPKMWKGWKSSQINEIPPLRCTHKHGETPPYERYSDEIWYIKFLTSKGLTNPKSFTTPILLTGNFSWNTSEETVLIFRDMVAYRWKVPPLLRYIQGSFSLNTSKWTVLIFRDMVANRWKVPPLHPYIQGPFSINDSKKTVLVFPDTVAYRWKVPPLRPYPYKDSSNISNE